MHLFQVEGFEEAVKQIIGLSRSSQADAGTDVREMGEANVAFRTAVSYSRAQASKFDPAKLLSKSTKTGILERPAGAGAKSEATTIPSAAQGFLAAALDAARTLGVPMPASALAYQLYTATSGEGHGRDDYPLGRGRSTSARPAST